MSSIAPTDESNLLTVLLTLLYGVDSVLGMMLNCIHIFIVTGSLLY